MIGDGRGGCEGPDSLGGGGSGCGHGVIGSNSYNHSPLTTPRKNSHINGYCGV